MNFAYKDFNDFLADVKSGSYSREDAAYHMSKYLRESSMMDALYLIKPEEAELLKDEISAMYGYFGSRRVQKAFVDAIKSNNYDWPRTVGTFCYTVAFRLNSTNKQRREIVANPIGSKYSNEELAKLSRIAEDQAEMISKILKCSRKIVKPYAKRLENESKMPRDLLSSALCCAPEGKYIRRHQIGYYMGILMKRIYTFAFSENWNGSEVRWEPFFNFVFGKDNEYEVCMSILLEPSRHRKNFIDEETGMVADNVNEIWEALTSYALKHMEAAPMNTANHMLQLYQKKSRMLGIDQIESADIEQVRINLLNIDPNQYPNLSSAIGKVKSHVKSAISDAQTDAEIELTQLAE